ncbi:MAG: hypothetical protein L0H71_10775, partial [Yaniella sp.]|nr:hypothetical protein [Yaniella sp.]
PSIESQDREPSESPQPETTDSSTSVPPEAPPPPSDDPEPTETTPTDTSQPPDTPVPSTTPPSEPSETAPSSGGAAPSPETTGPAEVPPQQPPSTSQAPVEQAPPQDGGWDPAPSAEPVPQPSNQSTNSIERNIRQHSDNPRHLLSQLWDTDSHDGSGLIMPKPRDNTEGATELETLPPVSEDELDAIKARVSTPDKGNGLDADEMLRADVNERLAHSDTWWLVSSVIGLVILGAGVWWAVARRKPKH